MRASAIMSVRYRFWWKGRDSNPRPRRYEHPASLKIGFIFNTLPTDVPLRLPRRSTTKHD